MVRALPLPRPRGGARVWLPFPGDAHRARYLALAAEVERLYRAILPDVRAGEFGLIRHLIGILAAKIRNLTPPADISDIVGEVEDLLDKSVSAQGYVIRETDVFYDLSKIDFEALRQQFERSRKRREAERLRGSVHAKLQQMVRLNRTRMDFLEQYQRLIEEYNAGSRNVEEFFRQLPEGYTDEECREKSALIYQHVYDNYWGAGRSVYEQIGRAA